MYTVHNFKTKKSLKEAVAAGDRVGVFQPGIGSPPPKDGVVHPAPHTWYARVTLTLGRIVKVR